MKFWNINDMHVNCAMIKKFWTEYYEPATDEEREKEPESYGSLHIELSSGEIIVAKYYDRWNDDGTMKRDGFDIAYKNKERLSRFLEGRE